MAAWVVSNRVRAELSCSPAWRHYFNGNAVEATVYHKRGNVTCNCPAFARDSYCDHAAEFNQRFFNVAPRQNQGDTMSDTLTVRKDRVLEAAKNCGDASRVLKALFPEAFEPDTAEPIQKAGTVFKYYGDTYMSLGKERAKEIYAAAHPGSTFQPSNFLAVRVKGTHYVGVLVQMNPYADNVVIVKE